tara:strand:- start:50 stop:340 length:291 start_codon:yes stop_codon:yes gene_type:complete
MADMYKQVDGIRVKMTAKEIAEQQNLQAQWLEEQSKNNETITEQAPYINQRKNAYPAIGDQLDMLWHSIDQDPQLKTKYFDFYEAIKAVKVKYPKS